MNARPLALLLLAACGMRPPPAPPPPLAPAPSPPLAPAPAVGDPRAPFEALLAAVAAGDEAACTPGFIESGGDSCGSAYHQLHRRGFVLVEEAFEQGPAGAVLAARVEQEGKAVDLVYLYLLPGPEGWRIDGLNEAEALIPWFLEGRVRAHERVQDLPSSPELEDLGRRLLAGEGPPELEEARALLARMTRPELVGSHWHEGLQRGVLQLRDAEGSDLLHLGLAREEEGWRHLGHSYGYAGLDLLVR